jgi:hypothetical protein
MINAYRILNANPEVKRLLPRLRDLCINGRIILNIEHFIESDDV